MNKSEGLLIWFFHRVIVIPYQLQKSNPVNTKFYPTHPFISSIIVQNVYRVVIPNEMPSFSVLDFINLYMEKAKRRKNTPNVQKVDGDDFPQR